MDHRSASRHRPLAALALFLLGLQPIVACNAVLGIEPAVEDATVGLAECTNRQAPPKTDCVPCNDTCQSECNPADCLADHECRESLYRYRNCVGNDCSDPSGACKGCMAGSTKALKLLECLEGCGCSAAAATSMCEQYCSCMQSQCADDEPNGPGGCLDACTNGATPEWQAAHTDQTVKFSWTNGLESWRSYCLWEHCELAYAEPYLHHCKHAVGKVGWCEKAPVADPTVPECPPGKRHAGSACNFDSDCCSTVCDTDRGGCSP